MGRKFNLFIIKLTSSQLVFWAYKDKEKPPCLLGRWPRGQGFRIEILPCSSLPHTSHRLYVYSSLYITTSAYPIARPARVEPETRQEKAPAFSC